MYDIFSNPKLKAIMTLYVMMMGFDLFGRIMLPEPQTQVQSAAEAAANVNTTSSNSEASTPIPENGDAIPINREGFGDLGDSKSRYGLPPRTS